MRTRSPLPPKLEALLIRLLKDHTLTKTEAVKLPYLINVIARRVLGRPISEGTYEAWSLGVVTHEVWHELESCGPDDSPFVVEAVPYSAQQNVSLRPGMESEGLSEEELELIDRVYEAYKSVSAIDLGYITKIMNPEITTWGHNDPIDTGLDAYDRLTKEYRIAAAMATGVTLESLHRNSLPVESIEDLLA